MAAVTMAEIFVVATSMADVIVVSADPLTAMAMGIIATIVIILSGAFCATSKLPLPASAPIIGAALLALFGLGYGVKRRKAATAA